MIYLKAFILGGTICALCQILIDKTHLTPGRIMSSLVAAGLIMTALGIYEPLVKWGGAGATVPILGFGYTMAKGTAEAVSSSGFTGIFTGGLGSAAGGIAAAVFFSLVSSIIFKPGDKR